MKQLHFDEKDFKKLENMKEEMKINGEINNWEEFILKLAELEGGKNNEN